VIGKPATAGAGSCAGLRGLVRLNGRAAYDTGSPPRGATAGPQGRRRAQNPNPRTMRVLGIETSCDETGVAVYDTARPGADGLLAHAVYSQIALHAQYGGVVPELASRDHVRKLLPLVRQTLAEAGLSTAAV